MTASENQAHCMGIIPKSVSKVMQITMTLLGNTVYKALKKNYFLKENINYVCYK